MLEKLGKEHHFALMNHSYEIDWLVGWLVIEKFGVLGNARGFVKNVIKYIPICGWFFGFSEHIFLQRSFDKDKAVIEERLDDILQYPDSSWSVMTAEGTRFTKEKHDASVKFAMDRNLVPLKYHLIPRAKGFITCANILKKYKDVSLLNIQLAFDKSAKVEPTLANLLCGESVVAHLYIDRIPIDDVKPTNEYLQEIYHEKDELQDSFLKYGNFYEGRKEKPVEGIKLKPRLCVAVNTIFWYTVNFLFMIYFATKMILAGRFIFLLSISGGVIALCKFSNSPAGLESSLIFFFCSVSLHHDAEHHPTDEAEQRITIRKEMNKQSTRLSDKTINFTFFLMLSGIFVRAM